MPPPLLKNGGRMIYVPFAFFHVGIVIAASQKNRLPLPVA